MNKEKRMICLLLALCLICLLAACGSDKKQDEGTAEAAPAASVDQAAASKPTDAPKAETASQTEAPAMEEKAVFTGSWKFYSQEGSSTITHEDVLTMQKQGNDLASNMVLTLKDGGTLSMFYFGTVLENVWTDNGDGTGTITMLVSTYPITLADGFLVIDLGESITRYERSDKTAEELGSVGGPILPDVEEVASELPSPSEAVPLPYTLENGLQIDELSVTVSGVNSWNFGYALHNPTDQVQIFQPTRIVLKTAEGKTIRTAAAYLSDDEVKPGLPLRVNTRIMDGNLLHLGDEVYYFYDDVFLGVVIAREF